MSNLVPCENTDCSDENCLKDAIITEKNFNKDATITENSYDFTQQNLFPTFHDVDNNQFWRHESVFLKFNKTKIPVFKGSIFDLLQNIKILHSWQDSCSELRNLRHMIKHNLDAYNMRTRTHLRSKQAYLDQHDLIRIKVPQGMSLNTPLLMPESVKITYLNACIILLGIPVQVLLSIS